PTTPTAEPLAISRYPHMASSFQRHACHASYRQMPTITRPAEATPIRRAVTILTTRRPKVSPSSLMANPLGISNSGMRDAARIELLPAILYVNASKATRTSIPAPAAPTTARPMPFDETVSCSPLISDLMLYNRSEERREGKRVD